jgi:hypothetical protein
MVEALAARNCLATSGGKTDCGVKVLFAGSKQTRNVLKT